MADISMERKTLRSVLKAVDERRFAIPKLQREFVWDGAKAAKLLDSVVRGMPIGTLMIWAAPRAQRLHLRQTYSVLPPFNTEHPTVWFIMDGQQRLSVLHHVREGTRLANASRKEIDFRRVVLALEPEPDEPKVRYRSPSEGEFVSLTDILSSRWKSLCTHLPKRKFARVRGVRKAILDYPLFLTFLDSSIDDVREAFLRINTQGMRITTADAIFSRAEELNLRDVMHEVRDGLDEGFRDIEEAPILFAMMATRGEWEVRVGARILTLLCKAAGSSSLERAWALLGSLYNFQRRLTRSAGRRSSR
jgi:hypothetical protein